MCCIVARVTLHLDPLIGPDQPPASHGICWHDRRPIEYLRRPSALSYSKPNDQNISSARGESRLICCGFGQAITLVEADYLLLGSFDVAAARAFLDNDPPLVNTSGSESLAILLYISKLDHFLVHHLVASVPRTRVRLFPVLYRIDADDVRAAMGTTIHRSSGLLKRDDAGFGAVLTVLHDWSLVRFLATASNRLTLFHLERRLAAADSGSHVRARLASLLSLPLRRHAVTLPLSYRRFLQATVLLTLGPASVAHVHAFLRDGVHGLVRDGREARARWFGPRAQPGGIREAGRVTAALLARSKDMEQAMAVLVNVGLAALATLGALFPLLQALLDAP